MPFPTISRDPAVQAAYEKMRKNGQSHSIAEMCATRTPTGLFGTERAFMQGKIHNNGVDDNPSGRRLIERAQKAGINISGKRYVSALGGHNSHLTGKRGPENPYAWVGGVDEVAAICRKEGYACEELRIKGSEPPPMLQNRLAADIVEEIADEKLRQNPGLAANMRELRESIIETHGQKKDDVNYCSAKELKKKRKVRKV